MENLTYEQFINNITLEKERQIKQAFSTLEYYRYLYRFSEDILFDVAMSSQAEVAEKLNIAQSKLSTIVQLLKGIHAENKANGVE